CWFRKEEGTKLVREVNSQFGYTPKFGLFGSMVTVGYTPKFGLFGSMVTMEDDA
ncbi:hypothetical protein FRX31_004002, partial [Thalictrum thalictroides]